jgi:ABC-type Fe3+-hydroxamate transport system substrate-binding protein
MSNPLFLPRIASLVPSVTELLVALGLGPCLVARTGFCIHPAAALQAVPKVGGTKDVNLDKLRRLAPTHVIVNVDENRAETAQALRAFVPHLLITHPLSPLDNLDLLSQLVEAFGAYDGVRERAEALAHELRVELDATRMLRIEPQAVLYLIWREPWMTVARDTYIARMLATVGWSTWPEQDGGPSGAARYPVLHGDEPWLSQVQQVLLSSEPYRFTEAHVAQAQALCPAARVRLVDGELLSWYGPRAAQGLRYLRGLAA